ncbi:MAG: YeaH/YhbH family protein [Alphaproteobacteria bacterium]|nr:YeaH/YhbH family protein [Alphaproteobacteria bacterium]
MTIIDRRLNPGGKSLANRQRFIRRAKAQVKRAVREASAGRSIKDIDRGGEVTIPSDGVREPSLRRSSEGGTRDYVLPGNKKYVEGDSIQRPQRGGGSGSEGSEDGGGEDEFRFALSDEEFLDLFLEDLELPDLAKRQLKGVGVPQWRRAGYSTSGSPSNISLTRTMRNSLSRRVALRRPKPEELEALRREIAAIEAGDASGDLAELRERLVVLEKRSKRIPFIDPIDVRFRRLESTPKPVAQAVMFCLMDVSGSMTEHMKDLAKRFYALLYLFLKRRYKHVEVVFIRHTHEAEEVDEQTFFYSRETGGTVVSTALEEMAHIVEERFKPSEWNIYGAQASDGDNAPSDNAKTAALLQNAVLPLCQYYAYLEVGADDDAPMGGERPTTLWRTYAVVNGPDSPIAMRKVRHRRDIFPVFRDLFQKKADQLAEA